MKRYLAIFMLVWSISAIVLVGLGLIIDPYRIFHPPWIRDNYYLPNTRIQAGGVINTDEFDSIILGTSMAANFSPKEASELFNGKFVNLSLDGSSQSERAIVLKHALVKRKISRVVYSLDNFGKAPLESRPIAPYIYIYDDNKLNDLRIYSDLSNLKYAFCRNILISSEKLCPETRTFETMTEWASNTEHSKRFGGLEKWLSAKNNGQIKEALAEISKSVNNIEGGNIGKVDWLKISDNLAEHKETLYDHLLKYAIAYPETKFYLFFPPYSRLRYAIWKQSDPQAFEAYIGTVRMVVNEIKKHPNVFVYGFDTQDFLDDIAHYKDTSHYSPEFNSRILIWMSRGEHLLTPDNLEEYLEDITEMAGKYPVKHIGDLIEKYLYYLSSPVRLYTFFLNNSGHLSCQS